MASSALARRDDGELWEVSGGFVPAPVEAPGGGRVKSRRIPLPTNLAEVVGRGGRRIRLHRLAAQAVAALQRAARAAGVPEPLLRVQSGFRDPAYQERLWQQALARYGSREEARKWVAPPGGSAHQTGRAVDFVLDVRISNSSRNVARLRTTPAYRWLSANAERFGFYPYQREPWHWEYNPPATTPAREATAVTSFAAPALAGRESGASGDTIYVTLPLGGEGTALPVTGIHWQRGFHTAPQVDVVLYLHGFKPANAQSASIRDIWNRAKHPHFALREGLASAGKNVVLVAPTLGPKSQPGRLTDPGGLDGYLTSVLQALAAHGPYRGRDVPQLGNLILACHSGGGLRMRTLALGGARAVGRIRECWGFDCTYNAGDDTLWAKWARSRPDAKVFVYYIPNSPTQRLSKLLAAKGVPNVFVAPSKAAGHNHVPIHHWRERLSGALFLKAAPLPAGPMQPSPSGAPARPAGPAAPQSSRPATGAVTQCPPPANLTPPQRLALAVTTNFETGRPFGCVVSKVDGISMGMLQWNLKAGTLQALLKRFEAQGGRLETHLGAETPSVRRLAAMPAAGAVAAATAQQLAQRWRPGLDRLCSDPLFCQIQVQDVRWRLDEAAAAARRLGLRTARGLSMLFDIQVGDGYGPNRRKIASFISKLAATQPGSERAKLEVVANVAADLAGSKWGEERRARRLVIARGSGRYRGSTWNLDQKFPGLDNPWDVISPVAPALPAPRPGLEPMRPERSRPTPVPRPAPSGGGIGAQPTRCPAPGKPLVDRCLKPGTQQCPPIPNLMCTKQVSGVPFEYPTKVQRDTATGISVVQTRQRERTQSFLPSVNDALAQFVTNCRRFGLPFEAILTAGSFYCRCMTGTNRASNHSFGDAIDIVGVRWTKGGGPKSRLAETVVHNYADTEQRQLLRRLNACLRLSFATVIDYHDERHRDHFHCDMNRGRGRLPRGGTTVAFVQEALSRALARHVSISRKWDTATQQALAEFAKVPVTGLRDDATLNAALDRLFGHVAAGR